MCIFVTVLVNSITLDTVLEVSAFLIPMLMLITIFAVAADFVTTIIIVSVVLTDVVIIVGDVTGHALVSGLALAVGDVALEIDGDDSSGIDVDGGDTVYIFFFFAKGGDN